MELDPRYYTKKVLKDFIKSYKHHKMVAYENYMGYRNQSYYDVLCSRYIVYHVEGIINNLDETERFILRKEIIEGETGNWFLEYFSYPSYCRHRKKGYEEFLRCLDN